jgi:hypothetical protein
MAAPATLGYFYLTASHMGLSNPTSSCRMPLVSLSVICLRKPSLARFVKHEETLTLVRTLCPYSLRFKLGNIIVYSRGLLGLVVPILRMYIVYSGRPTWVSYCGANCMVLQLNLAGFLPHNELLITSDYNLSPPSITERMMQPYPS